MSGREVRLRYRYRPDGRRIYDLFLGEQEIGIVVSRMDRDDLPWLGYGQSGTLLCGGQTRGEVIDKLIARYPS